MGLFEQLPYTNFHDLNLTELIKFVNETIKHIHEMDLTIAEQNQTISDFKDYVMDYLNNLDVEQDVKDYINELISNGTMATLVNKSWLSGKNIVWYGDSWGTTSDNPVSKFMSEFTDVNVTNRCIGGSLMTRTTEFPGFEYNSGYQLITSANDLNDFDYIFIMYGVNDWQTSRVLKTDSPDEFEFNYCVENVIDYLQTTYPTCIPVFIFQTYCYKTFGSSNDNCINYAGVNLPAYINNAIDICERRNVKYINLFELSGITSRNYATHLRNDGGVYVHLKSDMSERVSKLIYWGNFNTGRCYGDNWSNNIIMCSNDTASVVTKADSIDFVSGVVTTPMKKITTSDAHNLIYNTSKDDITVIHLTYYKDDTKINGLYVDRQKIGEANARLGITNINKIGVVDCYIEVNYADLVNVAILCDNGTSLLRGISATIRGNNKTTIGLTTSIGTANGTSINSPVYPTIKDGVVEVPSFIFTATNNVGTFTDLITNLPRTYEDEANYFIGWNMTSGEPINFYYYNGVIRSTMSMTASHNYIIPRLVYTTAH